jgi:hypothetical protein
MIEKLACRLGRNDEAPNIELAELLCQNEDTGGIGEIVEGLKGKDKAIASDCMKVLYEIGERKPHLISEYADDFLSLLFSRNNRLVWGSMIALAAIAEIVPDIIYKKIDRVLSAFNDGSVITVDNSITVLSKLCKADKTYESHLFPLLLEHIRKCRPSDVARHAERMSVCVNKENVKEFLDVLNIRKDHLSGSQSERVRKLGIKLSKQ